MKFVWCALGLLALPALASAQTPEPVVSWTVKVFAQGVNPTTGAPVTTIQASRAASQCGQAILAAPTLVVNPQQIRVEDPADATKDCILAPAPSGPLMALPIGAYFATVTANGATLTSVASAASNPFSRANVPAPPATPSRIVVW